MATKLAQYGSLLALVHVVAGCSADAPQQQSTLREENAAASVVPAKDTKLVVAFGDSLFAGYGLAQDQGFAPALERALSAGGVKAQVFNAGVSGDTSAAGLQRLSFVLDGLARKPDLVIVGLGGNDMLRGLSPEATRANLDAILSELDKRGVRTMLTGMLAAPNLGADYAAAFNRIYPELARKHGATLYPFFLDGVVGRRDLLLPDGIHPNDRGVDVVVSHVAPQVSGALDE
ncbi:arylesterase [Sphingomonas cavernae]|uniref:arylesterase n=1 Tax=Sphingomonas cavernae TaxID=2320861 RepID=UPI002699AD31